MSTRSRRELYRGLGAGYGFSTVDCGSGEDGRVGVTVWEYGELNLAWSMHERTLSWQGPDGSWEMDGADENDVLNELGAEGWEAYSVSDHSASRCYFMKRVKRAKRR